MAPPPQRPPRRRPPPLLLVVAASLGPGARGLDNGLALTPPMGWRSWNIYPDLSPECINNDTTMRAAMFAAVDRSRSVAGSPTSLKDLGFGWVSMDDGWQQCNCSTRQDLDPTLPNCSVDDCMGGKCTWHDEGSGRPMVNRHRFGDMKQLVDYGHSIGLKVGSYLNTCICMEAGRSPTHYEQDAGWLLSQGFDEVKVDSCGSSGNLSRWAELFNRSGKAIRVENCHNGVPNPRTGACPMHFYRTGGDIDASFRSILGEVYSTVAFNDRDDPQSRPGCWAYPDMLEVGNFLGADPQRSHEERSHFGLWCIVSAPLILGFNMTDKPTMDRVWPIITDRAALRVNQLWAGHPGTLVRSYPAEGLSVLQAGQGSCAGRWRWQLRRGELQVAPAAGGAAGAAAGRGGAAPRPPLCLVDQDAGASCPPPTTRGGQVNCGLALRACGGRGGGLWEYNETSGALIWREAPGKKARCLSAYPQEFTQFRTGVSEEDRPPRGAPPRSALRGELRVGDGRRRPAQTSLGDCPGPGRRLPDTSIFAFLPDGELYSGASSLCLVPAPLNGVELWSKPLPGSPRRTEVAALALNVLDAVQALAVPIADVPGVGERTGECELSGIWGANVTMEGPLLHFALAPHEGAFFLLACPRGLAARGPAPRGPTPPAPVAVFL